MREQISDGSHNHSDKWLMCVHVLCVVWSVTDLSLICPIYSVYCMLHVAVSIYAPLTPSWWETHILSYVCGHHLAQLCSGTLADMGGLYDHTKRFKLRCDLIIIHAKWIRVISNTHSESHCSSRVLKCELQSKEMCSVPMEYHFMLPSSIMPS